MTDVRIAASYPAGVNPSRARLPEAYTTAKRLLAEAADLDLVKEWGDRMAALETYARQAEDDELEKMARRIRGRAARRAGQLLREWAADTSQNARKEKRGDGADPSFPRTQREAAEQAGMSERQEKASVAISKIPDPEFEEAIEAEDPPTLTKLVAESRSTRRNPDLAARQARASKRAAVMGILRSTAERMSQHEPVASAGILEEWQIEDAIEKAQAIRAWVDDFMNEANIRELQEPRKPQEGDE
ncbi:MAG TPA: hypothetical protein RMF84_01295 [Polyangiaceae bacterium LLY-WYZ-14_1]|nr:hypothetical protein [Polyangiaceae bacterium LLY-WYZ-14_1]